MIAYFSGTGNSRFVAQSLADKLDEKCEFIPYMIKDTSLFQYDSKGLTIVCPVYSWGVPPVVSKFIEILPADYVDSLAKNNKSVNVVFTCGDETAMAPEMISADLEKRNIAIGGIWSVIMPNDYVLLPGFDVDSKKVEQQKLEEAPVRIDAIAECVKRGENCVDVVRGSFPKLKTNLIYPLFKRWGIFPNKWKWTEECISCGKCAGTCPVNNIKMVNDHPKWGKNCLSCLGCYHVCPTHAVAYGNITKNKGQYFLRSKSENKGNALLFS